MISAMLFIASFFTEAGCLVIDGARIRAADLAPRLVPFAALPPETSFALSPNHGVRRDISGQTLARWAGGGSFDPICVFRASAASQRDWRQEIVTALKARFGFDVVGGSLIVEEHQVAPGPEGEISLPQSGLSYDENKRMYLWRGKLGVSALRLRFSLRQSATRLSASRTLLLGQKVTELDLSTVTVPWTPNNEGALTSAGAASGKVLRRSLSQGTILLESHLITAPIIEPGDSVEVVSQAGRASVRMPAIARGKARLGDPLLVSTLEDHRLLRVIATGPGKAEIRSLTSRRP